MTAAARIARATAIAGTLDIFAAIGLTLFYGRAIGDMLRYVASGPVPPASGWGAAGAALGLAVHYALMAVMAAAYVIAADQRPALHRRPAAWGAAYGVATFVAMNLIVVPLRFGTSPSIRAIATQLFCHVVLVGIPIAFAARRR